MTVKADDTPAPVVTASVLRLDASTVNTILERFQDPSLLQDGRVTVMGLDLICDRLGARWDLRRDLVYDHVQRAVDRHLSPTAVSIRVAETLFVVVQPDTDRLAGQALCLRCLRDIHQFFLGQAEAADLNLHEVTRLGSDGLYGQKVAMAKVAAAEQDLPSSAKVPLAPKRATAGNPTVDQWTPFVAADGRRIRASCTLEPMVHLDGAIARRIGYRLGRRVIELPSETPLSRGEQQNLSRADIARIDYATLARGLDRLGTEAAHERSAALMAPASFVTLSNQRTREVFVGLLEQAKGKVQHGLICEIYDLEGVPAGALLATVALIKPFCFRIIGSTTDMLPSAGRRLKDVGLHGLSAECPPGMGDAEFAGWAKELHRSNRPASNTIIACGVDSMRRAALASSAGLSHATLTSHPARTVVVK